MPPPMPTATAPRRTLAGSVECTWTGKIGPLPRRNGRRRPAVADATATGPKLRGRHSKRRSSTARRTAAIGVAKVALIPAAAPATRSVFRSFAVMCIVCAMTEPTGPPVPLRAEPRHEPDDEPADDRHEHGQPAEVALGRRRRQRRKLVQIKKVGEKPDEAQQHEREDRADGADG